jgi:Uma2 family endonuclease
MSQLQTPPLTDTWISAPWADYLKLTADSDYRHAKGYYHLGYMRLEMLPVGFDHGTDHSLLSVAVSLYGILHGIPLTIADACSYRKVGIRECQPDLSVYVGKNVAAVPKTTNIVNLDQYPPPDLVIEIAKTTLLDDLGAKRSLYEDMGIKEYWVVDVEQSVIIAYCISNQGSHRIDTSIVIPGLLMSVLEAALKQARTLDQTAIGAWLMQQFQPR